MTNYKELRKDRLVDIIAEYITDEDTSALTFYNDVKDELKTWLEYHKKHVEKCETIINLIDNKTVTNDTIKFSSYNDDVINFSGYNSPFFNSSSSVANYDTLNY